jgi:hypothetical protein
MKRIKLIITLVLLAGVFFFGYWLKCQNDLDLVKSFHLGNYLPVQVLQKNNNSIIYASESEYLLDDSFESQRSLDNWTKLWMREERKVKQGYDSFGINNSYCLLIKSSSEKDWSYQHSKLVQVDKGDVFSFEGFVKSQGENINANLSVVLYDKNKNVVQWHYAKEEAKKNNDWTKLARRFMVPSGIQYIRFRFTGAGIGNVWFDNIKFRKEKDVSFNKEPKGIYSLENPLISYTFDTDKRIISVKDKRINKEWVSDKELNSFLFSEIKKTNNSHLTLKIIEPESLQQFEIVITIPKNLPEVNYEIGQVGNEKFRKLEFPPFFNLTDNNQVVLPLYEGLLIPCSYSIEKLPDYLRYKGGWPIPFVGVLDGASGWMEIVETPNDFEIIKAESNNRKLLFRNRWLPEKGYFGYKRQMRYCFFDKGGYVTMAKRYRQYAREKGLFKDLAERNIKQKQNVSKLKGAVDIWYWGKDKYSFAKELEKCGINKVLFSNTIDSGDIAFINKIGFLTSRYDIYQDVWPPIYHDVTNVHDGWPEDLVIDKNGNWIKGWTIKKVIKEYPGGVICSIPGLARAKQKIPQELKNKPYTARFIDTTTASPWRECYNPKHPTTRSEDIKYKMELLKFCSNDLGLVIGSEDGVDCAVPYCDYFEGMMSIGLGRLPDSGRNVAEVKYMTPTENFLKYQVGEKFRIPLWELVYHDAMVTTWYWGDSSNRIPEVWWRKDLFNILYGNMPLWAIRDWEHWKEYKNRFIESYRNVSPVFEKVGVREMLSHKFISDDRSVQETEFTGDIRIVVNFGEKTYTLKNTEYNLPAKGFVVFEKGKVWEKGICN